MFTATLRCGTVVTYEAPAFGPAADELVPCLHHGYRAVQPTSGWWLRGRSEMTVHALRRKGFTLRMVAAAERDGLVVLDLSGGRVAVRRRPRAG